MGNYHWYLKQKVQLPQLEMEGEESSGRQPTALVGVVWDPVVPLRLHLLTTGEYCTLGTGCTAG